MNISSGDIVKIQIINWREDHKSAHAKIIRLIARADDPDADYIWISRRYGIEGFNEHYTSKVDQYKYKNILENNLIKRKDLSQLRTFTIDPEDAKDFDDAISVKKRIHHTDLYIHIADVSMYTLKKIQKLIRMLLSEGIVIIFMKKHPTCFQNIYPQIFVR